jgi:hypothetical protein
MRLINAPSSARRNSRGFGPAIVEPHAVDHRAVLGEAEQPRLRIARLRQRGDRADLGEAEPEGEQRVGYFAVLVEPGGHAERVGKGQPGYIDGERPRLGRPAITAAQLERGNGQAMRPLGVE